MAGRVPGTFAPADEARMAGTGPAMTDKQQPVRPDNSPPSAYPHAYGRVPAVFAPADEARMAGTGPAMTNKQQPVRP
jgi:hypothetical protein